jgi:hypothetical protein
LSAESAAQCGTFAIAPYGLCGQSYIFKVK